MSDDSHHIDEPETARKDVVIGKLAAAEAARRQERDRRREEATEKTDPRESIAQYLSEFNSQTSALDQELEALSLDNEPKRIQELLDEMTAKAFQVR